MKLKTKDRIVFVDWEWGEFDLNALISKRVAEVLTQELTKEPPYAVITGDPKYPPLTMLLGFPFSEDVFFHGTFRHMLREVIEDYRPGLDAIDPQDIKPFLDELRQLVADVEAWCAPLDAPWEA